MESKATSDTSCVGAKPTGTPTTTASVDVGGGKTNTVVAAGKEPGNSKNDTANAGEGGVGQLGNGDGSGSNAAEAAAAAGGDLAAATCAKITCSVFCEDGCGWNIHTSACVLGGSTSQSEIDARLGDCRYEYEHNPNLTRTVRA